jgi:hypothetical protein
MGLSRLYSEKSLSWRRIVPVQTQTKAAGSM